jgi:uncharacterized protein (TIGR03435 family)
MRVRGDWRSNPKKRIELIMKNRKLNSAKKLALAGAGIVILAMPIIVGVLDAPVILAQQPDAALEFEVASVRPANPDRTGILIEFPPGGGLHATSATLKDLIETAYQVRSFQILEGPSWTGATRYNVNATSASPARETLSAQQRNDEVRLKVQALLKDRFKLNIHRETREIPEYSLVVTRNGVKTAALRATNSPRKGINAGKGTMTGEAAPMSALVFYLSRQLDRPVVNDTGLEGNYDFTLQWTPDQLSPSTPDGQSVLDPSGPSLFTAVQEQLGLRLAATKGLVDVIVIDGVERPSEN